MTIFPTGSKTPAGFDPVTVVLTLNATQGHEQALIDELGGNANLNITRNAPGALSVTFYLNQDKPGEVVLIQQWTSQAQYDDYIRFRSESGDLDRLLALTATGAPTEVKILRAQPY